MTTEKLDRNLPQLSTEQISMFVSDMYQIEGEYERQNAERDLSYRIRSQDGVDYVVKVSNAAEPEGIVDFQIKALEHIAEQDSELPVPRMIPTKAGKLYDWIQVDRGDRHMIRMLNFLEGEVMEDVPAAFNDVTRFNLGVIVGRLARALRNFFHPNAGSNIHLWDLHRCLELRPHIGHLPEAEIRDRCSWVLDYAEDFVLPQSRMTRWQVVHKDAHSGNTVVDPQDPTKITGIIDFGDLLFGSIVGEIAGVSDCYGEDETDPLRGLCAVTAGFDSIYPLEEREIDLVYDLTLIQFTVDTVIIGARDALFDGTEPVHIENTGHSHRILKLLMDVGREEAIARLRAACRFPPYSPRQEGDERFPDRTGELLDKRRASIGDVWYFYDTPLHFTRSSGPWLFTSDGTAYLDAYNNVQQVGHANPHVSKTIARQAAALNINTRYICDIVADYAERLTADLPDQLDTCIFVNSGSEANDVAMQMAKFATGNSGALVMEAAYHGMTETTGELSPETYALVDYVECLQVPDMYRGPFADDPVAAEKYAADADRAIAALAGRGHQPAAFMVDTALCSNAVLMAPDGYFELVAGKVRRAGGMVIADEVQAGLGRLGDLWGFRAQGLESVDFVTMGKPVGNGYPLGVVITNRALVDRFAKEINLFSTFGGNPVACAAGMAVLDEIERRDLIRKSNEVGDYFRDQLRLLADRQPMIGDVRGKGMMIGIEFVNDRETKLPAFEETSKLISLMKDKHVLVSKGGPGNTLKVRPNFSWEREQVDQFIDTLDHCLSRI